MQRSVMAEYHIINQHSYVLSRITSLLCYLSDN